MLIYIQIMETVHSLRKRGYKVRVLHNRVYEYRSDNTGKFDNYLTFLMTKELSAKGGSTVVELTKGQIHAKGEAICHPEDNYDKKEGVRIALGRALDELEQKFCKWTISIEYEFDILPSLKEGDSQS